MSPYIIEHLTRGLLRNDSVPPEEWHWSHSAQRNDFDKIWSAHTLEQAKLVWKSMPTAMRGLATIRQYQEGVRWPNDSYVVVWPPQSA